MMNDRPINDPNLQAAINEVRAVLQRRGLAGTCMIVSPDEAAYAYVMSAPWSAIQLDANTPLGFRITAKSSVEGQERATARMGGALHTICQLSDFGAQTQDWMEQLKAMLRGAGVEFDHRPFNGMPLPPIVSQPPPQGPRR